MKRLVIKKARGKFEVDNPTAPGSPPIGRGRTLKDALGDWLINNQKDLDIFIDVDPTAQPAEDARRRRELAKR